MWIYWDAQIVGCISQKHCLTSLTVKLWRDGNLTGLPFPVLDVLISAWSTRMQESYKSSPNRPANRKEKLTPLFSDQKAQEVGGFGPKPQIIFHFRKLFSGEGRWGGSLKHVIIVILPFQLQTSLSRIPNVINQKFLRFSAANNAVVTCFSVSISTCLSSRWKSPRNKLTAALYALYRKAKGYLVEIWWLSNSEEPTVHAATSPASHWSINRGGQSTNCDENCN